MMIDSDVIERLRASSGVGSRRGSGGLFQQKRNSISLLMDPSVVAHLNQLNLAAMDEVRMGEREDEEGEDGKRSQESLEMEQLGQRIAAYNRDKHQGAFTVTQTEGMSFEGALRFYFEDGSKTIAKAIWLTNQTAVDDMMPSIQEKFHISDTSRWKTALYQVQNSDEILLAGEERPLDIAINSKCNVRFIVRMESRYPDTPRATQPVPDDSTNYTTQHKSLSRFFGVESSDLAVPYHAASLTASPAPTMKGGNRSPSKSRKQNSVDSLSLSSNSSSNSGHLSSSFSKQSNGTGSVGNGSTPGLILKTHTPNFIRKFQSSEGPLRNFTKKDRGANGRHSPKKLDPRKRSRAKSLSIMFEKGLSLYKKDDSVKSSKEISSEDSSPGLLKVFGDKISPSATYKSVLASAQSSAVALVKVVLERYSLPVDTYRDYVLCDVIGNYKVNPEKASRILGISEDFDEKQEWETECMRVMGDDERPLAVKSFWKPEEGFARRFEIRRRCDIAAAATDTITHGINVNAKRLQLSRAQRALTDTASSIQICIQEDESKITEELSSSCEQEAASEEPQRRQSENEETESSDEQLPVHSLLFPPHDIPYLLTLQGNNPDIDQILYILDSTVCLVGHSLGTNTKADIELDSADINQEHCRILKRHKSESSGAEEDNEHSLITCDVFVEPVGDSKVLLNGAAVLQRAKLSPGDLIGIGDQYLFLVKNPLAQPSSEAFLMKFLSSSGQSASTLHPDDTPNQKRVLRPKYASPHIAVKALAYSADEQRLKVSYPMKNEVEVLNGIASLLTTKAEAGDEFTLSLSYLMCMCVEHSAYKFGQEKTKRLMLRVATLTQTLAWDKTKETARNQQDKPSDVQTAMGILLPDLRVIVRLLANALEVLNFLQTNMGDYIAAGQGDGDREGNKAAGSSGIEDEALVELEEVVMYTFQQMVYYLTKTLYISIPNFLDTNPFSDDEEQDDSRTKGMDNVLSVFRMTFDLMRDLDVHPEITSQLFAYLLFFTNASLFNMLVERGMNGKFYKWSKGAQIRGNLDVLEGWIQEHDLQDQAKFLTRVSMAIDLLATPKVQLMQADWSSLRQDFPALNATQLNHFLSQYQLAANQSQPAGWLPRPEEMKSAADTENILECFDNHPALVLPNHGFKLNLRQPIRNRHFTEQLDELKRRLPYVTFSLGIESDESEHNLGSTPAVEPAVADKASSSSESSGAGPVPPPRTRTYRYPHPDHDTETAAIEVLKRPLEVTQAAPVAVANTVKVPPTEVGFLSEEEKMSPRVFPNNPLMHAASKPSRALIESSKLSSGLSKETSNTNTNVGEGQNADSGITTVSVTAPKQQGSQPLQSNGNSHSEHDGIVERQDSSPKVSQNGPQQTGASITSDGHLEEFEEPKKPCPTLSSSSASSISSSCSSTPSVITLETDEAALSAQRRKDSVDDVFVVDLEKGEEGVGLGLIDGMHTPLRSQGIYVRKLVPGGSALQDGRLMIGDRILAVNGTSLVGADYNSAMQLIRTSGKKLRFLVAKSEPSVALKITASTC